MPFLKVFILLNFLFISTSQASIWLGQQIPDNGFTHASIGQEIDSKVREVMFDGNIPGLTLAVTKRGRLVFTKGYGYSNWSAQNPMQPNSRAAIGSTTKVLVSMGMMHLLHNQRSYGLGTKVYGPEGILKGQDYEDAYTNGLKKHYPIVGMAINRRNRVITWYSDGVYTVGNESDLSAHRGPRPYTFPPGKGPKDVVDMVFGGRTGNVVTYFRDKTFAFGKVNDLDSFFYSGEDNKYKTASKKGAEQIIGIAADTRRDVFYAFYDDGTVSSGDSMSDLSNLWVRSFLTEGDQNKRYKVIAMARSDNGNILAWYRKGKYSRGTSLRIGAITPDGTYEMREVESSIRPWKQAYRNITIENLLTHTSGLVRSGKRALTRLKYSDALAQYQDDYEIPYKYIHRYVLSTSPLLFRPGNSRSYSNHGMGLTGHLIKKISGQNWYQYIRDNLLNPVGLGNIAPVGQYHNPAIDSRHHSVNGDNVSVLASPNWPNSGSAAGSLRSSSQDLAALLVRTDGLANYPDFLPGDVLQRMETRPFPNIASGQAIGWQVSCMSTRGQACESAMLNHNGASKYGTSYMAKYKSYPLSREGENVTVDDVNVVVIANSGSVSVSDLKKIMNYAAWSAGRNSIPSSYDLFQSNPN